MKVSFFACPKCGEWRYSTKNLKTTRKYKCLKCSHSINLEGLEQTIYDMPNRPQLKIQVLQEIKAKNNKSNPKDFFTYKKIK